MADCEIQTKQLLDKTESSKFCQLGVKLPVDVSMTSLS